MNGKFEIKGGKPLKGEVETRGAKNAAFPILAATLLTDEACEIDNLPLIEDVFKMIDILKGLGSEITWLGERKIKVKNSSLNLDNLPREIVRFLRGSILITGPLLARFGEVEIPPPGGCLIGSRPIDTHLDAFSQMGINSSVEDGSFVFKKDSHFKSSYKTVLKFRKDKPIEVVLKEFSVTATENVLLYSARNPLTTVLKTADQDYQIQELVKVLREMGAEIKDGGCHSFEIKGKKKLKGFKWKIISDPIETGTFIAAILATRGHALVRKAQLSFLDLFLKRLSDFGARFEIKDPETIEVFPSDLKIDKIQSLPYPGIHSDLQPELGVLATQTPGPTLIHDPLYEGRLKYLEELNKMGADIIFCDPHRGIVYGPTKLYGREIPGSDLRAGAALVIAGLISEGKTVINNVYQIDRGYEKIEERLKNLGADIKRICLSGK